MKFKLLIILFITIYNIQIKQSFAQDSPYISPVDFTIKLAGNVGEIRSTHFHSGIDIKATKGIGSPIFAVSNGYITRIGVSPTGYGKVLYLTHDNGETSVYAHLDNFENSIAEWVRKQQLSKYSFKVNLYPRAQTFRVKQGDIIGYMGNSGSSGGPHLHFEIRNKYGNPRNIITDGDYYVKDSVKPTIFSVSLYVQDTVKGVLVYTLSDKIEAQFTKGGSYEFTQRTLHSSKPYYLVYEVIDRKDGVSNTMGIHSLWQSVDSVKNFGFQINQTSFATTKYINTFTQYDQNRESKYHVLRAYVSEHNGLNLYSEVKNRGIITPPKPADTSRINVVIEDDNNNSISLDFNVVNNTPLNSVELEGEVVNYNKNYSYLDDNFSVQIPKNAIYDNAILPFKFNDNIYTFGSKSIPLHKPIEVNIKSPTADKYLANRALLSQVDGQSIALLKHSYGYLRGELGGLGDYKIIYDTIAPKVVLNETVNPEIISLKVTDNISGIESYSVRIDGNWALGQWDPKNNELLVRVTPSKQKQKHIVSITLEDYCSNSITEDFELEW